MVDLVGQTIEQYQITERLGRGGMADVYKAFHPGLAVYRAVKIIRPEFATEEDFKARFQREAQAVAALRHANIVQMMDFGVQDNLYYMVMEFIEGTDLKAYIIQHKQIRFSQVVPIIEQVASALSYAHQHGVVHRDIKPANIMLTPENQAILTDFGIAKMITQTEQMTRTGVGIGTPSYMAPEQARALPDIGPTADIYSLGIVLYEMLTGHLPYSADTPLAVILKVVNDPLPPPRKFNPNISDALQGVVFKATAKDPAQRYQSCKALVEALKRSLNVESGATPGENLPTVATEAVEPIIPSSQPLPVQPQKKSCLIPILVTLALLCLLAGLAAGGAYYYLSPVESFLADLQAEIDATPEDIESPPAQLGEASPTPTRTREATRRPSATPSTTIAAPASATPEASTPTPAPPTLQPTATAVAPASATPEASTPTPAPPTLQPTATAVAPASNLLQEDFATITLTFGQEGSGPGQFSDARSVAVNNSTGHIYVGEYQGGRIQVFDAQGNFINEWQVDSEMPLRGMAADDNGLVYIVQSGLIFGYEGATGALLGEVKYGSGWGFDDIALTADGGLVASWYRNRDDIVRFDANGQIVQTISSAISGQSGQSELNTRIAVDRTDNIYALGSFNGQVFKFAPDGTFVTSFGDKGQPDEEFSMPSAITTDKQGRVYVSVFGGIQVFDSSGQYLDTIDISIASGMIFNNQNELLVAARDKVIKCAVAE